MGKIKEITEKLKESLTAENVLLTAMKTPGVKINRSNFLHKELIKFFPEDIVQQAIKFNPAKAGIARDRINRIAQSVINYETNKVTGLSVLASLPSSAVPAAVVAAVTADITSYFAHILRVVQKLAYLYGFEAFELNENDIDSETMNFVMVFLGVMFGVQGAGTTLQKVADIMAKHVAKSLAKKALTKGTVFPIVRSIVAKIGIRLTKQMFADAVASVVPIAGSVASGALTYAMFKPCCMKLKKKLMTYQLCDPNFYTATDDQIV